MIKQVVTKDSYVTIDPGKSLTTDIPLSNGYDIRAPGEYGITYSALNQHIKLDRIDTLKSNTVMLQRSR
jgi:hypothetical protein